MPTKILSALVAAAVLSATAQAADVGQPAPNCHLTSLDGKSVHDLPQFKGKVVYVDFWASWCGPCAQSFPFMSQMHKELSGRGLQVLAINLDEDREEARAFIDAHPTAFAVLADNGGRCPMDFGVHAMPSSYLIDRKGIIRHVHLGFRPGEAENTRRLIEQLLAEPTL